LYGQIQIGQFRIWQQQLEQVKQIRLAKKDLGNKKEYITWLCIYNLCMNRSALYKGCLEPIVLRLLKDKGRMYGYQITQLVKEMTRGDLQITEGALYPLLHRLEERGVVETEMENIGNRVRKYYSLTKSGKKEMNAVTQEMASFMENLNRILNPQPVVK
jgi:PadR family transcriptional regulator PadR